MEDINITESERASRTENRIAHNAVVKEIRPLQRGIASTTQTPAPAPAPPRPSPRCSRRWDFGSVDKLDVLRTLVRLHDHRVVTDQAPSATHAGPKTQGSEYKMFGNTRLRHTKYLHLPAVIPEFPQYTISRRCTAHRHPSGRADESCLPENFLHPM